MVEFFYFVPGFDAYGVGDGVPAVGLFRVSFQQPFGLDLDGGSSAGFRVRHYLSGAWKDRIRIILDVPEVSPVEAGLPCRGYRREGLNYNRENQESAPH